MSTRPDQSQLAALAGQGCYCTTTVCGDGFCDPGEGPACSDCFVGPVCGDGACEGGEGCGNCPGDCDACAFCGDGFCDAAEDCTSCAADCSCAFCGDLVCDAAEDCTTCASDCACPPGCGDGYCAASEDCVGCASDCDCSCGDGLCDAVEGLSCSDCVFDAGESLCTSIAPTDFLLSELAGAFGIVGSDVTAAFALAKGTTYDFTDWCGPGCSTTFIGAYFDVVATMTVRGVGDTLDYVDWLMVCAAPDGTLFANDDYDTSLCTGSGLCDPGMNLMGSGLWTCLFGAAPFASQNADPYGPICITTQ